MDLLNKARLVAAIGAGLSMSAAAHAGVFIATPMSGDADSGISTAFTYTHAYDVNGGPTVINGVTFAAGGTTGSSSIPAYGTYALVGDDTTLSGFTNTATGNVNSLLSNFNYPSATTQTLQLNGLTPGQQYTASFYNAAYGAAGGRVEQISANDTATGHILFDENFTGQNSSGAGNPNKLLYTYTAPASGSLTFTYVENDGKNGFHQYGFSNQVGNANYVAIPNLYNTGVSGANNADGTNTTGVVSGGSTAAGITVKVPSSSTFVATKGVTDQTAYKGASSNAEYVNDQGTATGNQGNEAAGAYDYRETFDLTGFNPATAILNFQLAADDGVTGVLINGQSTGITTTNAFNSLTDEQVINSGFVSGINTIDFIVTNGGTDPNPTGFLLDNFHGVAMAVPEPASLSLLGFAGLGLLARRRQN